MGNKGILVATPAYYLERVSRPKLKEPELVESWVEAKPGFWGGQEFTIQFPKKMAAQREFAQGICRGSILSLHWILISTWMRRNYPSLGKPPKGTTFRTHLGTGLDCSPMSKWKTILIHGTSNWTFRIVLPQYWRKVSPRIKAILIPPNRI